MHQDLIMTFFCPFQVQVWSVLMLKIMESSLLNCVNF
jgi:hypothetical protein